jgi:hypothetical protein
MVSVFIRQRGRETEREREREREEDNVKMEAEINVAKENKDFLKLGESGAVSL